MSRLRRTIRGVTLVEIMIVVVILGILAVIAYPNYRQYAARAKRNEAISTLVYLANMQEQYYSQNFSYTADMTNIGFAAANNNPTETGTYIITVTDASPADFTAVAAYQNTDDEFDKCSTFTIDGQGNKTSAPYNDCWTNTRR
jgi:type IV pilus assembly protein PilE